MTGRLWPNWRRAPILAMHPCCNPPAGTFAGRGGVPRLESGPVAVRAQMAELVDALVSGISDGNIVGVRVPFWAPKICSITRIDNSCDLSERRAFLGFKDREPLEVF